MEDTERIKRLEYVLGTLISWMPGVFSTGQCSTLLEILHSEDPKNQGPAPDKVNPR